MCRRGRAKIDETPIKNNCLGIATSVMFCAAVNAADGFVHYMTHFWSYNHDVFQMFLDELLQKMSKIICLNRWQELLHNMG